VAAAAVHLFKLMTVTSVTQATFWGFSASFAIQLRDTSKPATPEEPQPLARPLVRLRPTKKKKKNET
jgi:hypothetical protein